MGAYSPVRLRRKSAIGNHRYADFAQLIAADRATAKHGPMVFDHSCFDFCGVQVGYLDAQSGGS